MLALVGTAGFAFLALVPTATVLTILLAVRGLTDHFADANVAAGLNAGAVVGIAVVAIALARLALTEQPRGLVAGAISAVAILLWFSVAYVNHGFHELFLREVVRFSTLIAVALIALNHGGSLNPSRLATIVVWTSMLPASTVVIEAALQGSEFAGDFRAQGTLAHPNTAALLLATAMPLAAWRWACDDGGRRYLLALGFLGLALLLTKSLGGLGQAVIGLTAFAVLYGDATRRWLMIVLIGAFVAFVFADPLGVTRLDELETTNVHATHWGDTTNSLDWRIINFRHFLEAWREEPLLGQGLGATVELVQPIGFETHSDPLRVVVETGIVGAVAVSLASFAWINHLILQRRTSLTPSYFSALLAVFIGFAAHSVVTHATQETAALFLVAALIGGTLSFRESDQPTTERPVFRSSFQADRGGR